MVGHPVTGAVLAHIAAAAARAVRGVHAVGPTPPAGPTDHRRPAVAGSADGSARSGPNRSVESPASLGARGAVEVGLSADRTSATVRLRLVTEYGRPVQTVCETVRRNVTERIRLLTGVRVIAVDITVDDLFVEGDDTGCVRDGAWPCAG